MATMHRNKSDYCVVKQNPCRSRIKPPSYITLSDFMRIQNEINPVNSEYENRKAHNAKLKMLSQTKSKNWPDSIEMRKKNQFFQKNRRTGGPGGGGYSIKILKLKIKIKAMN